MESAYLPHYSLPPRTVAGLLVDLLTARRRSFRADGLAFIQRIQPPMRVFGAQHIPLRGPCVITFNHFYRPDFNVWYAALALAALVPAEIHFVMTGELTFPGKSYAPLGMKLSKLLLRRVGRVYGFTTMPPMPPRPQDVEARADAVRAVVDFARRSVEPLIGLAPEGGDSVDGRLARPAAGVGRFALLLAARGLRVAPLGVYEEHGEFCLHFGEAYELSAPRGLSADEKDRLAAQTLMEHIAVLVPSHLRGEFGG